MLSRTHLKNNIIEISGSNPKARLRRHLPCASRLPYRRSPGKGKASRDDAAITRTSSAPAESRCSVRNKQRAAESSSSWHNTSSSSEDDTDDTDQSNVSGVPTRTPKKRRRNQGKVDSAARDRPPPAATTDSGSHCSRGPSSGRDAANKHRGKGAAAALIERHVSKRSSARGLRRKGGRSASNSSGSGSNIKLGHRGDCGSDHTVRAPRKRAESARGNGDDSAEGEAAMIANSGTRRTTRSGRLRTGKAVVSSENARGGIRESALNKDRPSKSAIGNDAKPDSYSAYACGGVDDGEKSEVKEKFELQRDSSPARLRQVARGTRLRKCASTRNTDCIAPSRNGARADLKLKGRSKRRDASDEDQYPRHSPVALTAKARSSNIRAAAATAALFGDDDEEDADCLRDTDSERAVSDEGGDASESSNEPVICRCGARDWKDGERWIRCDGQGCRTWEHLRCAYPRVAADEENEEEGKEPNIRLCDRCKAKGSAAVVVAAPGRRRLLTRGNVDGSEASNSSLESSCTGTKSSKKPRGSMGSDHEEAAVRRSRRVARRKGVRPLLLQRRKNVVGDEAYGASSHSDDVEVVSTGFAGWGSIGGDTGDDDSDSFWAPEGQVEATQEFCCRCGATHEEEGVGGVVPAAAAAADSFVSEGITAGCWVQCRSDSCGVWEHAACCEYGCSPGAARDSPAVARGRKHWCRACDPNGKKHARCEERRLRRKRLRAEGGRGGEARAERSPADKTKTVVRREESGGWEQTIDHGLNVLHCRLWGAVAAGDAPLVEQAFREIEGKPTRGSDFVRRVLDAAPPPAEDMSVELPGRGGRGLVLGSGNSSQGTVPTGISLLMLAAGYWKSFYEAADCNSVPRVNARVVEGADTMLATENRAATTAGRSTETTGDATPPLEGNPEAFEEAVVFEARATSKQEPLVPRTAAVNASFAAGLDVPTRMGADTEPTAFVGEQVPDLGSETRLAVLRLVLARGGGRAMLAVDCEGRTAVHHAAVENGAGEVTLLLAEELGGEAAILTVRHGSSAPHAMETSRVFKCVIATNCLKEYLNGCSIEVFCLF